MLNSINSRTEILWRQVWGLAALLAAIIFSWMAYGFYQPKILQQLDFFDLAAWLGIFQGFLAAIVEPFIGGLSDRIKYKIGSRLPMISVGVTLAGLIFVASALLVEQNIQGQFRWVIPILMTFWVVAMIIFRGPAIALLAQFAPMTELPQANSILLLVFGLLGAAGPLLNILLEKIGASITFVCGAITLVLGAYLLRSLVPQHSVNESNKNNDNLSEKIHIEKLLLIFLTGLAVGFEVSILLSIFPKVLQAQLPTIQLQLVSSSILLVSALISISLGELSGKIGANRSMLLGLMLMTGLMGLSLINQSGFFAFVLILAFGVAFGLVFISMIPLALGMLPPSRGGLATGLYFGGSGAASAIVGILVNIGIEPMLGFGFAVVALLGAILVLFGVK